MENDKLQSLLKDLNKSFGENSVIRVGDSTKPKVQMRTTGVVSFDKALGGGLGAGRIVEIFGAESGGKAQPLSSKILTPQGWTTMGEIKVGQAISTPDGGESTVIGIYPQGEQDVYEFIFDDKSTCRATLDHLWYVEIYGKYNKVLSTKQLIESGLTDTRGVRKFNIPSVNPINFSEEYKVSGHTTEMYKTGEIRIPEPILRAPVPERLGFLEGILCLPPIKKKVESLVKTKDSEFSKSFKDLVRGLGLWVSEGSADVIYNINGRYIESIKLVGREECQCIMIGHPDHLYITDNYIPTHNTTISLLTIAEEQKKGGLCAFIDVEQALDFDYATFLGVNTDDLIVSQPNNAEESLEILDRMIESGIFSIIVLDSIAALVPKAELEGEMGDQKIGVMGRLMSQAMRKITGKTNKTNTTVVLINQLRDQIGCLSPDTEVEYKQL